MNDQNVDMRFPLAGQDNSDAFCQQNPRKILEDQYARSTAQAVNVQGFDASLQRGRGGSRPGLSRYIDDLVSGEWFIIQDLAVTVHTVQL